MIIDVHSHLGYDRIFDVNFTAEELIYKHDKSGVDVSIVQPGTCHDIASVKKQHDAIYELSKAYKGEFYGMACVNPHTDAEYEYETRRCIEELGFVGIKLHPFAHAVNPESRDGNKVFELADRLGVPLMIHTGNGIPFAAPSAVLRCAGRYPKLKLVLAHCGGGILAAEMPPLFEMCPNVYADTSWTMGHLLRVWSDKYGTSRFMMGSDHADNAPVEIAKINSFFNREESAQIFEFTSRHVYSLI